MMFKPILILAAQLLYLGSCADVAETITDKYYDPAATPPSTSFAWMILQNFTLFAGVLVCLLEIVFYIRSLMPEAKVDFEVFSHHTVQAPNHKSLDNIEGLAGSAILTNQLVTKPEPSTKQILNEEQQQQPKRKRKYKKNSASTPRTQPQNDENSSRQSQDSEIS